METIQILDLLKRLASDYPELRLGQIIANACGGDPFYFDDAAMLAALKDYAKHLRSTENA